MIHINLLPVRAAQKRARAQRELFVFGAIVSLAVVGCFLVYGNLKIGTAREMKLIDDYNRQISELKPLLGEVAEFKKKQAEFQEKLDVLSELKRRKSGPVHLLDELNRALPEKLWLEDFEEVSGSMKLKGVGVSESVVAGFITALEASPYYRDVDLKVTKQIKQEGVKLQSFEIECREETPPVKHFAGEGAKL
ncbi:MAG: PilN domain-containing protein [Syntrophotalea acetylenica]|jgi:type IV pilus assembly protein PilN|uniref:PilN domain-containing protein n=1 Tax=Syntrophotalea sp. TaxID=2812029 RepID=UPI003D0B117A|nr:PilN domain-containing protein [Syntrophotalea acetylenica]